MMLVRDMAQAKPTHDPGGKVRLKLKTGIRGEAVSGGVSDEYRYRLSRKWAGTKPFVLFVLMNPSTADPNSDDPTVAKCADSPRLGAMAALWLQTRLHTAALKRLLEIADPVGAENDKHIIEAAKKAAVVVFAYGQPHKALRYRGPAIAKLLIEKAHVTPHVLSLGKTSRPLRDTAGVWECPWNR